jgi:arginyl-tRNA--protein-N-Asp/Glu arginylyltransferase
MSGDELDRRLEEGWFRSGPFFMRADLLYLEDKIRGLVSVRLPLDREAASRSRRRVLRRNRERFRCEVGPARVDSERERLYRATKHRFMGFVSSELAPLVFGLEPELVDTHECCVYDGHRLVAVSYFDMGEVSIASQLALHDPEFARYGLGFYTMLEEIEFARARGLRHFYPGYVVPGLPSFDYKLRIGDVQYLGDSGRWRRRAGPPRRGRSLDRNHGRIEKLQRALEAESVPHEFFLYPGFVLGRVESPGLFKTSYLRNMAHFRCGSEGEGGSALVIEVDEEESSFVLSWVVVDDTVDVLEGLDSFDSLSGSYELRALEYRSVLHRSSSVQMVARTARSELGLG